MKTSLVKCTYVNRLLYYVLYWLRNLYDGEELYVILCFILVKEYIRGSGAIGYTMFCIG